MRLLCDQYTPMDKKTKAHKKTVVYVSVQGYVILSRL